MSTEQRDKIVASDEFMMFFDRASRLVERALTVPSDILFDYVSGSGEEGRWVGCFNLLVALTEVFLQGHSGQPQGCEEEGVCGREMEPEQDCDCYGLVKLCEQ